MTTIQRKFTSLPLGSRFVYPGQKQVWVVLERHECGLVATWNGIDGPVAGQSICSAADSESECQNLIVHAAEF